MSKSLNQVILLGNLTRDPEVRSTPSGQAVVNFSLALNRSYKDKNDEWVEVTDFVDCVAWANLAENVGKFLRRGSKCLVSGRLQTRSWEQDGQKRNKTEVLANDVHFLDTRKTENAEPSQASDFKQSDVKPADGPNDDVVADVDPNEKINLDDIPF